MSSNFQHGFTHRFNTGRPYAKDGQPISVLVFEDRIYFTDEARGIDGSMALRHFDTLPEFESYIMRVYGGGRARGLKYEFPTKIKQIRDSL